jgi:hypothetical protein
MFSAVSGENGLFGSQNVKGFVRQEIFFLSK